jgi:hypothetical protein
MLQVEASDQQHLEWQTLAQQDRNRLRRLANVNVPTRFLPDSQQDVPKTFHSIDSLHAHEDPVK